MNWLSRFLGGDDHDHEADEARDAKVAKAIAVSDLTKERAERAIAEYRHADDAHRTASAKSRQAAERLIDEVEDA